MGLAGRLPGQGGTRLGYGGDRDAGGYQEVDHRRMHDGGEHHPRGLSVGRARARIQCQLIEARGRPGSFQVSLGGCLYARRGETGLRLASR